MIYWSLRISQLRNKLADVCLVICLLEVVFHSNLCGGKLMGLDVLALAENLVVKIINDLALAVTADQFLQPIEVILT